MNKIQPFKKSLIALAVAHGCCALPAVAATITVDSTDDLVTADANCTLREAIQAANTDMHVDNCGAGSGADSIDFDDSLNGSSITLAGQLDVTTEIAIDGDLNSDSNADITLDGDNATQMFDVSSQSSKLTVNGLKLINGSNTTTDGGAISVTTGELVVSNSYFGNNYCNGWGGAIAHNVSADGPVNISSSVFRGNRAGEAGGAIAHERGVLSIRDSVFDDNQADNYGGGLFITNGADAEIINSSISSNRAGIYGGGLYVDDTTVIKASAISGNTAGESGGGVYDNNGPLQIINSTISGNSAVNGGGGGVYSFMDTAIVNSTIVNNSAPAVGGIYFDNSPIQLVITNSIVANNSNGDCLSTREPIVTTASLIADGGTNCGTPTIIDDPLLGELQDNGGPTLTHLPAENSPVIDAGDNTDCGSSLSVEEDQRGELRDDGACDIGAVERQPATSASSSSSSGTVSPLYSVLLLLLGLCRWRRE